MRKWVHIVNQYLAGIAGWLMFAMMLLLVADVITRSFDMPLQLMAELSVFVMMIVIYLGFSRCEEHGEHVRLEFAVNSLPKRAKSIVASVAQILAVAVIGLMLYAVSGDAWTSYVTGSAIEGTVDMPIWPTKFVMVIGMVFFLLQGLVNLFDPIGRPGEADHAPEFE